MPARYENYNLLERLGPGERVHAANSSRRRRDAARGADGAGVRQRARGLARSTACSALDLRYTLADNDLPKVARTCELAGVEVRFPLLDDAVVAFSARLRPA